MPEQQPIGRVVCVSRSQVVASLLMNDEGVHEGGRIEKGSLVKIRLPGSTLVGMVSGLTIPVPNGGPAGTEAQLAELELVGEISRPGSAEEGAFRRGISAYPALGDLIHLATSDDVMLIYRRSDRSRVEIGTLHNATAHPVFVSPDELVGRHLAVLGTTGSGKSSAVTALLRGLLQHYPNGHILMFDPHNEYASAFGEDVLHLGPETMQLPYWLLNSEEITHVVTGTKHSSPLIESATTLLNELIPQAKRIFRGQAGEDGQLTVDTPVPYRMSDVVRLIDESMGRLERSESLAPFRWLKTRLTVLANEPRYGFMFGGITVQDTMARIVSTMFRIPIDGKPIAVIDLSAVPSEVVNVVVSVISRMAFDFAVWSRGAQPILLVCEEAHRYAPAGDSLDFEPTKQALARIAKEGRKYGLSLCLVSQRPSELSSSILSQCNTVFAFRMTNSRDQEFLQSIVSDDACGLMDFLPVLGDREAIVAGQAVGIPVRICLPQLAEAGRPRGAAASFAASWEAESRGRDFVAEVVRKWRRQQA